MVDAPLVFGMTVSAGRADGFGGFVDDVGAHGVFGPAAQGTAFVPELVLEDDRQAGTGDDGLFDLLAEAGLAAREAAVEVDEDGVQRNAVLARAVPVIHVRLEPLPGPVAVHPQALVEAEQAERPHTLRQVRAQPPEQLGGRLGVVPHHAILVAVERVVRGERGRGVLDERDEVLALGLGVDALHSPEERLVLEAHRYVYRQFRPPEFISPRTRAVESSRSRNKTATMRAAGRASIFSPNERSF